MAVIIVSVRSIMPTQCASTVQVPTNRKIVRRKRRAEDLVSSVRTVATVKTRMSKINARHILQLTDYAHLM